MDTRPRNVGVVLLAAGQSTRMGGDVPKVFRDLGGRPVLAHVLQCLASWREPVAVVAVARPEDHDRVAELGRAFLPDVALAIVAGGRRRQDSVRAGLASLRARGDVRTVLVHDTARPLAPVELFAAVAAQAARCGAAVPGVPVSDTLRRVRPSGCELVSREDLYQVQTPQGFDLELLWQAHQRHGDRDVTDDAMLMEALGHAVAIVPGDRRNLKLTHPEDFSLAEVFLAGIDPGKGDAVDIRVGLGHDLHRLEPGGPLRLGGVDVPAEVHAVGHSDGDALLHALTDALLGALALDDIGRHFPDSDPRHRGRDSATMLGHARELVEEHGYRPVQVDTVVVLERPRLAPVREALRRRIAELLGLELGQVSVKAKTGEGFGELGAGRAISCQALVQLRRGVASPCR